MQRAHYSLPVYSERKVNPSTVIATGTYSAGAQVGVDYSITRINDMGGTPKTMRYRVRRASDNGNPNLAVVTPGMALVAVGTTDPANSCSTSDTFIVTAVNDGANWIEIENNAGIAQPSAGGVVTIHIAIPNTTTIFSYSRGVVFSSILLPKKTGQRTLKNLSFALADRYGVKMDDSQTDFVSLHVSHVLKNPFYDWLKNVTADVNVYDRGDGTFYTILAADPARDSKLISLNLVPGDILVNAETWPQKANLYIETASASFADYEQTNLDRFARTITRRITILPGIEVPYDLRSEIELSKIPGGEEDYLLFFLSISGEGDGGMPQKVGGRVTFDLEWEA